ncbi:hypothetical protein DXG01_007185 [Tephrocybe rancida]|nr:hypothetical protein DXG01_007185 [Tephrocybe rancida]
MAAKHDFLGNREFHHRHHFTHHHLPASLVESLESTATAVAISSAPRLALPTSRFTTSTIFRVPASPTASFVLEPEVEDPTCADPEEPTSTCSNSEDPTSSEISTISEASLPTQKVSKPSLTPNGNKAGIAGGDAYPFFKDHIGWWYDWTPHPSKPGNPIGVPMLWGAGTADSTDAARLADFKKITSPPPYVLAYEEPDCPPGSGSAGMSVASGVSGWESLIVPLGRKGSLMGSPSMCKQADETWLSQFGSKISTQWDFTAVHINKNNLDGVKKDIEHYWNTYKKPIWVTEFACVNDKNGFVPCTNQGEINNYISTVVKYLESDSRVYAYAYSNGLGLGNVWPLMRGNSLSESGKAYLAAVRRYH